MSRKYKAGCEYKLTKTSGSRDESRVRVQNVVPGLEASILLVVLTVRAQNVNCHPFRLFEAKWMSQRPSRVMMPIRMKLAK